MDSMYSSPISQRSCSDVSGLPTREIAYRGLVGKDSFSPLVTIVIPMFNTPTNYLRKCLSTFKKKPDDRIELVVVDDGSDHENVENLRQLLAQVKVPYRLITQRNGGQNAARNRGIAASRGEYLMFLDSDDYLDLSALSYVLDTLERLKPQMLGFNYRVISSTGEIIHEWHWYEGDGDQVDKRRVLLTSSSLWSQVYSKTLFADGYRLVVGPRVGEDLASVVPLILRANPFVALDCVVYNYVQHRSSITHSNDPEMAYDILDSFDQLLGRLSKEELADFHDEIEWLCILHVLYFGSTRALASGSAARRDASRLRAYLACHFPNWRNNPILAKEWDSHGLGFKVLLNGHPYLYLLLHGLNKARKNMLHKCEINHEKAQ